MYDSSNIHKIHNHTFQNFVVSPYFRDYIEKDSVPSIESISYTNNPTIEPSIRCINSTTLNNSLVHNFIDIQNSSHHNFKIFIAGYTNNILCITDNCFLMGTIIQTDQGNQKIENITTDNTINKHKVVKLHITLNDSDHMVEIKRNALGDNIPYMDTYVTFNHLIMYKKTMIPCYILAKDTNLPEVSFIKLGQQMVYNIELEEYSKLKANNIIAETYRETKEHYKIKN